MPDMREKVKEYIKELEVEINRRVEQIEEAEKERKEKIDFDKIGWLLLDNEIEILSDVKNDLNSRLEELI